MKKRCILSVIIISVAVIILVVIFLFLFTISNLYKETEIELYGNLKEYVNNTNIEDNYRRVAKVTEYNEDIYYIHPDRSILYRYPENDDVLVSNNQMDFFIISDDVIYYIHDQELFVQGIDKGSSNKISDIYSNDEQEILLVNNKLFFINENRRLCSYNVITKKVEVLSDIDVYSIMVYGQHIFMVRMMGVYAMDFDGNNQNRIINRGMWVYEIYDNDIYFINDDEMLYKIDLEENTFSTLIDDIVRPDYLHLINGELYFVVSSKGDLFVKTDLNGKTIETIYEYSGKYSTTYAEPYYCIIIYENENSTVVLHNTEKSVDNQKKVFNNTRIKSINAFEDYNIILAEINEKDTYIICNKDYNEIERIS